LGMADYDQLDDDQTLQFTFWVTTVMLTYDNAQYLNRVGMLDDDRWELQRRNVEGMFGNPGVVQWWKTGQPPLSPEFIALVEEILGEEPGRGDEVGHVSVEAS